MLVKVLLLTNGEKSKRIKTVIKMRNYAQILCDKNVKNRRKYKESTKTIEKLPSKLYNVFIK